MLPSNWAAQVLDVERYDVFCRMLSLPDDGLRRAHHVTQPGKQNRRRIWRRLVVGYIGHFWAEHQADDFAGRAKRKPRPQYWFPARDGRL